MAGMIRIIRRSHGLWRRDYRPKRLFREITKLAFAKAARPLGRQS